MIRGMVPPRDDQAWGKGLLMKLAIFSHLRRAHKRKPASLTRPRLERLDERSLLSVNLLNHFDGLNYNDDPRYQPPDPDAAAGPDYLVETVNSSLEVFDKNTGLPVFFEHLEDFFAPIGPGDFVFDPVVTYDETAGRFFVAALDGKIDRSFLDVAVSNTSNPLDGFTEMHRINLFESDPQGHGLWGDYPKLGFNADAYVLTVNMLQADRTHDHVQVVAIAKASVLDADPTTLTAYQVDRTDPAIATMAAATMHGARPGDPMYFVTETTRFGGTSLRVVQMTDVLSDSPSFTDEDIPVPSYDAPPPAVHPGGTIDTFESFILNADWRHHELVATHHVGSDGVARVRWYQFDTAGDAPSLVQSGEINQGPDVYTYFSAIAVADNGDIGLTFMESSATEFVSMCITGRQASDAAGTMQLPVPIFPGQGVYPGIRGGDYSAITVDPVDGTFWAANMYKSSTVFWSTGIANFAIVGYGASPPSVRSAAIPGNQLVQFAGSSKNVETGSVPAGPQGAVVTEMIIDNRQRSLDSLDTGKFRQGARHPEDDGSREQEHFQAFPEG